MSLSEQIAAHLPYLRRYARALTGTQQHGDAYVRAVLETILADVSLVKDAGDMRVALYRVFHKIWESAHIDESPTQEPLTRFEATARDRLSRVTPLSRQALLLTGIESFSNLQAAEIMGVGENDVASLVAEAFAELDAQLRTNVLIIEDEPVIALDLEGIVTGLGHEVSTVAVTRDQAVAAAKTFRPGLVLADIQLADGSSGIDAVKDILSEFDVPVIFITAFPERLLTGERPEPTFLISKPFKAATVKAAIGQALFFNSSEAIDVAA